MHVRTGDQRIPGGIVVAGGALATAAGALDWVYLAPADAPAATFGGVDLSAGVGSLAFGVALVVIGLLLFARGRRTGGRGASIAAVIVAVPILLAAGVSAVAPAEALAEFQSSMVAAEYGIDSDVSRRVEAALEAGDVDVSARAGPWVATVGGLMGLAGGIAGVRRSRRIPGVWSSHDR